MGLCIWVEARAGAGFMGLCLWLEGRAGVRAKGFKVTVCIWFRM